MYPNPFVRMQRKALPVISIIIGVFPAAAYTHTPWQSHVVYAPILTVPVLIAIAIALSSYRRYLSLPGVAVVMSSTYAASLEKGKVTFYVATSLSILVIAITVSMCLKTGNGS